jgi:hypothetical protein
MFSTLKRKGAKNSYEDYPTKFAGSTQNPEKNIETSNQPIRTNFFPKKIYLVPRLKEPKIRMGASRRNLQAQAKNLKKFM